MVVLVDQDVLRLEVKVDDAKGVEVGDALTNLEIGTQGFWSRKELKVVLVEKGT